MSSELKITSEEWANLKARYCMGIFLGTEAYCQQGA
uniref:Uncharacterized protein n=1 Tax=Romanomermis culicivorax TaxID=13658 RepID=A0A915KN19_ROMCU